MILPEHHNPAVTNFVMLSYVHDLELLDQNAMKQVLQTRCFH